MKKILEEQRIDRGEDLQTDEEEVKRTLESMQGCDLRQAAVA